MRTVITVAKSGEPNGKSRAHGADKTRQALLDELPEFERLGYSRIGDITIAHKATSVGMRWIATVKVAKED